MEFSRFILRLSVFIDDGDRETEDVWVSRAPPSIEGPTTLHDSSRNGLSLSALIPALSSLADLMVRRNSEPLFL